ncbi:MAG: linear amide C-N hydrolase [Flavisolibacter sp.]
MLKKVLCFIVAISFILNAFACTTFFIEKNGQMIFGRNYDWVTETGMVNTNLRGLRKTSLELEKGNLISWTSKYGSITFNQYGKEFPTGGMNEKGLVVELMWLSESRFPQQDKRPGLSVLQWIQYQLDNCSSIDEVIATDKMIRIISKDAPQHYLVADAKGNAATIEFLNGKMNVHKGPSLPYSVLTNSTYQESITAMKHKDSLRLKDNSLQRFGTTCNMIKRLQQTAINKPLVDYGFDILKAVSQGDYTKWSIVYDISNKKVYFKTAAYQDVKTIAFQNFDFSCTAKPLAFNMSQAAKGEISKEFIPYSNDLNKTKLKEAFTNSRTEIRIDEVLQNAMGRNAEEVRCEN